MGMDSEADLRKLLHDLSNELFLIRGYAEFSQGQDGNSELVEGNLEKILERTDHIRDLIESIRAQCAPES